MKRKNIAAIYAILAAAFYSINIPVSKILLTYVQPKMMAAFLYLGAGLGLLLYSFIKKDSSKNESLTKDELPYTIGMVVLDIAAPILLMVGLTKTSSANASLLNNFEIVATSLVALLIFKEVLSKRLVISIFLVTVSSVLLSFEGTGSFSFNFGSLLVLAAACCWGFENNCTRKLSSKSSVKITTIKGICCGIGSLILAFVTGEKTPKPSLILAVLVLGFVAYGLSINFYIKAQKDLGAAKTGAYYSTSPFLGVILSMVLLGERPTLQFYIGLAIMLIAVALTVFDTISLQHTHEHIHTHTHEHSHGDLVHTHAHDHAHTHIHAHTENSAIHTHEHKTIENHNHKHAI